MLRKKCPWLGLDVTIKKNNLKKLRILLLFGKLFFTIRALIIRSISHDITESSTWHYWINAHTTYTTIYRYEQLIRYVIVGIEIRWNQHKIVTFRSVNVMKERFYLRLYFIYWKNISLKCPNCIHKTVIKQHNTLNNYNYKKCIFRKST